MIKLIVAGAAGRMGQAIIAQAREGGAFNVIYGLENPSAEALGRLDRSRFPFEIGADVSRVANADVVIDFTMPEATLQLAPAVAKYKKPLVIGTTGFTPEQEKQLKRLLKAVPVLKSANMSIGVNLLFKLAAEAAEVLKDYGVSIEETHHIHKKDKPSGTALQLGGLMQGSLSQEITYVSNREGEVVGDHRVIFNGAVDRLELFHHAENRSMFAAGALVGARWLKGKKPGFYTMQEVLGLK